MPMNVPKIIWQTHNYEFDELPDHLKMITQTWINLNPGWDYRYVSHTEREEIVKKYPKSFKHYQTIEPIFQADVWRNIVTYEHGGVYADMDSICIKPLDYLLNNIDDCEMLLVPLTENGGHVGNGNFAIKSNSEIMKRIINLHFKKNEFPFSCFAKVATKSDNVLYQFTSAIHSQAFKTNFDPISQDFWVDNYGEKITYREFIRKYNLTFI